MKKISFVFIVFLSFSCTKSNTIIKPFNINGSLMGKYELVKIYNHATCCNGGESTISEFDKKNTIVIDETTITEFEGDAEINKFGYEKKTELIATNKETIVLNIINLNTANKTMFQTIGWMQKLLVSEKDKYLILGVRWGKEGELTDYYFQQK